MALYDRIGAGYRVLRQTDPRIGAQIRSKLGASGPVINVGAGAGSYEPSDVPVVAVDPSMVMLAQRPPGSASSVGAAAESLPFDDGAFAAGMAILTVHHWTDPIEGLIELRRVVRGPIVILTWDVAVADRFWLVADYVPMSRTLDRLLPAPADIAETLGGGSVEVVTVPHDCTDGFYAAWWRRPEAYLDPSVRAAISGLARLPRDAVEPGIDRLASDLADGTWHHRHGHLLGLETLDAGYRLVSVQ